MIVKRRKWAYILGPAVAVVGLCFILWLNCLPSELFGSECYSTVVYDRNGELLGARIADDGQWRFEPCDSIPEKFEIALIEFEDRYFYRHCGVNFRSLGRAALQNIRNHRVVSGGSTISMQVVRLLRQKPRSLWEKCLEICMAFRLETVYEKSEILNLYASYAPFGGNVVGLNAALWRYLGDSGAELSWAQAATLAVLQNAPSSMHLSKNRDQLLAKRNRLLERLFEAGKIGDDDYNLSLEEPLIGDPFPMQQTALHLVEWYNANAHGKAVQTGIDVEIQRRIEDRLNVYNKEFRSRGAMDMAAVIVEVESGEIVAYCGNCACEIEREGKWVDLSRAARSSGSILKPLLYAGALQNGTISPYSLLPDVPTNFGGFSPKNFDGTFSGAVSADVALALSLNVPNVYLLEEFGLLNFSSLLQRCGLDTISGDGYGLSLILGGAEVRLVDIVSCYAKMVGVYLEPSRYQDFALRDRDALRYTFEALCRVNRPDQLDLSRVSSAQNIAWKTGTSYGSRDAWAVGMTPEYVVGVWVGNADGSAVADLTGARFAGPVMFDLFSVLGGDGFEFGSFGGRAGVDGLGVGVGSLGGFAGGSGGSVEVGSFGGFAGGSGGRVGVGSGVGSSSGFAGGSGGSVEVEAGSGDGLGVGTGSFGGRAGADCGVGSFGGFAGGSGGSVGVGSGVGSSSGFGGRVGVGVAGGTTFGVSSVVMNYFGGTVPLDSTMDFIYPSEGSVISLPRQLDGSPGSFVCEVAVAKAHELLFWHLDGHYLGATSDIHQMSLSPPPGVHHLTVVDSLGTDRTLEFIII